MPVPTPVLPIILLAALLGAAPLSAQLTISRQVIAVGGTSNAASGRNFLRFSATIGQSINGTFGGNPVLTAGFQQPDVDGIVPVIEVGRRKLAVKVYPNPVRNELSVEMGEATGLLRGLELYDPLGRRLRELKISSAAPIAVFRGLQTYPSGTYFLRAVGNDGLRYDLGRLVFVTR